MMYRWSATGLALMLAGCINLPATPPSAAPAGAAAGAPQAAAAAAQPGAGGAPAAPDDADHSFDRPSFHILEQREAASDADVVRAISEKLRHNLKVPRGVFPKTAEVTVEAMLAPSGHIMSPRVAKSSGYKALDAAVLRALSRAQPLPVTRAMRESGASQRLKLRFRPLQRP